MFYLTVCNPLPASLAFNILLIDIDSVKNVRITSPHHHMIDDLSGISSVVRHSGLR